jgi:two-component system, NarL family, nitrate/nitrite sensor histidine kinase NarX
MSKNKPHQIKPNIFNAWFIPLDNREVSYLSSGRFRILALISAIVLLLVTAILSSGSILPGHFGNYLSHHIQEICGLALILVITLAITIWKEILNPLLSICRWADSMRAVNLNARVEIQERNDFFELGNDINMLANMIGELSSETEVQLQKHTDYISRESQSLAIQYDVASSINNSRDISELFNISLDSLSVNLNASAGVIRQVMDTNELEVVAQVGELSDELLGIINKQFPTRSAYTIHEEKECWIVSVPMNYRDELSGIINLIFSKDTDLKLQEYDHLLHSIGLHLGTAIEKYRLDEEESHLLVMQERTRFSHELHDSLAQTIAGLRIQIRVLDEIFYSNDEKGVRLQMERIEYTITEANKQLRELIAYFMVPMNKRGLMSSIENAIQRHRESTDIQFYFQNEWPSHELPAEIELHILRIVQESLANISKHSRAKRVRILMRGHRIKKTYSVLIEDDGIGFDESLIVSTDGNHLGLNILRDRATQVNGIITIDSGLGEGTQINLTFELLDGEQNIVNIESGS